jgi:hypothetical protein
MLLFMSTGFWFQVGCFGFFLLQVLCVAKNRLDRDKTRLEMSTNPITERLLDDIVLWVGDYSAKFGGGIGVNMTRLTHQHQQRLRARKRSELMYL